MNTNHISWIVPGYLFLSLTISGCFTPKELSTESIPAIKNFDLKRYLGMWYEVARLPQSFENGLDRITATYTLQEDGTVKVLNKGFNTSKGGVERGEWKSICTGYSGWGASQGQLLLDILRRVQSNRTRYIELLLCNGYQQFEEIFMDFEQVASIGTNCL
jgi:hypothetical protein